MRFGARSSIGDRSSMDRKSGVAATLLLAAGMSYRGGAPKGPAGVAPGVGNSSLQAMAHGKRTSGAGSTSFSCDFALPFIVKSILSLCGATLRPRIGYWRVALYL